jgi:succinate dehydrogenase/fumarate reductase flavoprotein subunit
MVDGRWQSDVLVVGGGIAAAFAACEARAQGADVLLVDQAHLGRSGCTALASGVFQAYEPGDDDDEWVRSETSPLTNQRLFKANLGRLYESRLFLEQAGLKLVKDGKRVLRVGATRMSTPHTAMMAEGGPQLGLALRAETLRRGVRVVNRVAIMGLLTSDGQLPTDGRVVGAVGVGTRDGRVHEFQTKAVVMCTGPFSLAYQPHSSTYSTRHMPINASGAGIHAMWEAGAVIGKVELGYGSPRAAEFQCAPAMEMLTALGGHTVWMNARGERFLTEEFRKQEWGRSSVMTAVMREYSEGRGPVGVNVSHFTPEQRRLLQQVVPIVIGNFESAGYNLAEDTVPYTVGAPLGHGTSGGGARINEHGETSLSGLYAAGNCCDGAYISLGQSLHICALTGRWAGERAGAAAAGQDLLPVDPAQVALHERRYLQPLAGPAARPLRQVQDRVARVRLSLTPTLNAQNLEAAMVQVDSIIDELHRVGARDARELAQCNALRASLPIMRVILQVLHHRTESRGNLIRDDYPYMDNDQWLVHTVAQRASTGETRVWDIPIPEEWWISRPNPGKTLHPYFEGATA